MNKTYFFYKTLSIINPFLFYENTLKIAESEYFILTVFCIYCLVRFIGGQCAMVNEYTQIFVLIVFSKWNVY